MRILRHRPAADWAAGAGTAIAVVLVLASSCGGQDQGAQDPAAAPPESSAEAEHAAGADVRHHRADDHEGGTTDPSDPSAPGEEDVPSVPPGESRTFGDALDADREMTPLADILAQPERYEDQVVRTEGEITSVCQAMGCWMEVREAAGQPPVRVPMAGHSFFLPRDVSGRHATLEGRVVLRALSPEMREHLASEGATATSSALAIHATGVVIDG
ncbi:MAG: DUF4920 domain-containing protein [Sandaracinaceae bacterium]